MPVTKQQIIEAIKISPFTSKDYSRDISITIDGIVDLFPGENKNDILKSLSSSDEIQVDTLTGRIEISKNLFKST